MEKQKVDLASDLASRLSLQELFFLNSLDVALYKPLLSMPSSVGRFFSLIKEYLRENDVPGMNQAELSAC